MSSHNQKLVSATGTPVSYPSHDSTTDFSSQRLSVYKEEVSSRETADFLPQLFQSFPSCKLTDEEINKAVNHLQNNEHAIKVSLEEVEWTDRTDRLASTNRAPNQGMDAQVCHRFDQMARAISPSKPVQRRFVFLDQRSPQALPGSNRLFESAVVPDLALVPTDVPEGANERLLISHLHRNWSTFDVVFETKVTNKSKCIDHAKRQLLALIGAQPYRMFALGLAYYSTCLKVFRLDQCGFVESTEIDITKLDGLKEAIQLLAWMTTASPEALGVIPGVELEWTFGPMRLPRARDTTVAPSTRDQHFRQFTRLVINTSFFPKFSQSVTLSIDETIVNRCSAQGRGTRVWKVKAENHPFPLILKISFQPPLLDSATAETKFHHDFPAVHWPQSILTAAVGMASDAKHSVLKMRGLSLLDCPFKDRIMAINVVREAQSLDVIDNPVVLLHALIDIINAVQTLYDKGYLHRDLSTSNVGYISDVGNVCGVIYDFDMATNKERPDSNQAEDGNSATPKHTRTGTLPFMAMGLIDFEPDRHDLCHNLESIFWIFITTLALSKNNQPQPPLIAELLNAQHRSTCFGAKVFIYGAANKKKLLGVTDWKFVQNPQQKLILESLVYDVLHEVIDKSYKTKPESESAKLIHLFRKAADDLEQMQ